MKKGEHIKNCQLAEQIILILDSMQETVDSSVFPSEAESSSYKQMADSIKIALSNNYLIDLVNPSTFSNEVKN